jgi:hypothetical protein
LCDKAKLSPEELQQVLAAEKRENLQICLTGSYKVLCHKDLLSRSELEQVLAAERAENLNTCLTGRYPSLCDQSLLTNEQRSQAQAAEKTAAAVQQRSAARPRGTPTRHGGHSGCAGGHWVDSVSSDGAIVKLEDGSVWEVDAADAVDSALWLPTTEIVACDDKLVDTDDSETVSARRLR